MKDRGHLDTEQALAGTERLDELSTEEICRLMNAADQTVAQAVEKELPRIAELAGLIANRLTRRGRLFYVGAGTSGRLGVLDATECPPTFRAEPGQVQGILAGGYDALVRSVEGAEDRPDLAAEALAERNIGSADVVVAIAAGGTTLFAHAALSEARRRGAATGFITCVRGDQAPAEADVVIRPLTGPEVVTGSTRLKAGTATKMILNMLTTAAFIRMGKVHGSRMVDLRATNDKLWDRGTRLVAEMTSLSREDALALLRQAEGWVKLAVVMHHRRCDLPTARMLLDEADGHLRRLM